MRKREGGVDMRRRAIAVGAAVVMVLGLAGVLANQAVAHQCTTTTTAEECEPTDVYPNWRDNIVPVADLADRDDEEQRRDAQRWRDENGCLTQYCVWADPTASVDDGDGPLTVHGGTAGDHSLGEAAHSDEGHVDDEFGNHDSHGGAIYVDLCLGSDAGGSYEDQAGACTGMQDTQAGITVVDHLTCPIGCADEYHVVRPLDQPYTEEQLADSQRDLGEIGDDPQRYACGYEEYGSSCYGGTTSSLPAP